ncbi:hypothetical protein [Aeromonas hydrophila]|uniref:hypothetical protein n=1 Tax=Aeromonas hydrophila TaxID=644 RepID=UPI0005740DE6|nr:hypothetical protein [Aeromonas hydrophila]KHN59916.1 hypothetical protein OI72_05215 [Aeromonas hydrophila]OFC42732.1 hypothetical protein BA189_04245 [Aeromonas hydrophila]OFC52628.1 hypothetical protein BA188_11555 [Aeromonas hydrophila]
MRRYRIEIVDDEGNSPLDSDGKQIGPFDTADTPGRGLNIEFDALIAGLDVVVSGTVLTIYGLPITMLRQSVSLTGKTVKVYAGFDTGLPLANRDQFGLIISGKVFNAWANWLGTYQTLNLHITPMPLTISTKKEIPITLDGKAGEKLSDVMRRGIQAAYPNFKRIDIFIGDDLVLPEDGNAPYQSLSHLSTVVRSLSKATKGSPDDYQGIQISIHDNEIIRIFDGTAAKDGVNILPHELVGQPTWIELNKVSFKCPMRADLSCGDIVVLPQGLASSPLMVNTDNARSSYRDASLFSGKFLITSVRHIGEFSNPDGSNAWNTIYEAIEQRKDAA